MARRQGQGRTRLSALYNDNQDYIYYMSLITKHNGDAFTELGWEKRFTYDYHIDPINMTLEDRLSQIGETLISWGVIEREKEIKALQHLLQTDSPIDYEKAMKNEGYLLKLLNQAYNVEGALQHTISVIKGEIESKTSGHDAKANEQFFITASNAAIEKALRKGPGQKLLEAAAAAIAAGKLKPSAIQKEWDDFVDAWIDTLINSQEFANFFLKINNLKSVEQLEEVGQLFDDFKRATQIQLKATHGSPSAEKMRQLIQDLEKTSKDSRRKKSMDVRTALRVGGRQNEEATSVVAETLAAIITSSLNAAGSNNSDFQLSSHVIGSKGTSADIISFARDLAYDITGDLNVQYESLVQESKTNARNWIRKIEAEYAKDPIKDKFITYESTKLYFEETMKSGFHGTSYNYQSALALLNELNVSKADFFLHEILNTMEGAILEGEQTTFENELKRVVIAHIGAFLFDDFWNIGKEAIQEGSTDGFDAIHLFRLTNVVVPLSTLLIGLGNAAKSTDRKINEWAKVHLSLKSIVDESGGQVTGDLADAFKAASTAGKNGFLLTIQFLRNFTTTIAGYLSEAAS